MNVKAWQILCFLAVIIGATIVVYPTQRRMLPFLFDSGRYKQARSLLNPLLEKFASDEELVWQSVRLYLLEGSPDDAIDQLKRLDRSDPLRVDQLMELAKLYTWTRNPLGARRTLEVALENEPDNETIMTRLIGFYRYAGETEKEASLVVRLMRRQSLAQTEPGANVLADLIANELEMKGRDIRVLAVDPLEAMLISGLYQIYMQSTDSGGADRMIDDYRTMALVIRCLEQYVWAGFPDRGETFAQRLDRLWDSGINRQLQLAEVMRWSDMNREALDLLKRLHQRMPVNRQVLMAMATAAVAAEDPQAAIDAYEALARLGPMDPADRQHLMALYLQTGQVEPVLERYRQQFEETRDVATLYQMLDLALAAGDDGVREAALQFAATVDTDDAGLLIRRARLYLALNRPADAYPLLKQNAAISEPSTQDLMELIRVAGYTSDAALTADALDTVDKRRPDDPDVLTKVADGWLAAGYPERAYGTMQRLTTIQGNRQADISRTLKMAEHTGDARLIHAAIEWVLERAPDDADLVDRAIDLYLASGQADRAYRLKAESVLRHGRVDQVPALIRLAESTGQSELREDALRKGLAMLPGDADLQRDLARFYLSQGSQEQAVAAFEKYLEIDPGDRAAQIQLAQLYEWQHQPRKALSIYRQLADAHPGDAALSTEVVRLTRATGDREEMLNLLMAQADAHPDDADKSLAAGRALVAESRLEPSVVYLERAARLDPNRTATWQELADVYAWTGRGDGLILALENLARQGALEPQQRIQLADAYLNRQRPADALPLLKDLETLPDLPFREGFMLVEAYEQTRREAAAMRIYRRLLDENRDNATVLSELGDRALWREHTNLALRAYGAALKLDPHNRSALKGSGQIHAWNNNHPRAIDILETYNRHYPLDYEAQYLLGELYFAANRQGAAQRQYRKAMKLINMTKHQREKAGHTPQAGRVRQ